MDQAFCQIEKDRVESVRKVAFYSEHFLNLPSLTGVPRLKIRSLINKYSEELFRINYHPRPEIERLLDAEIQVLNNHILINKSCYAHLYAKMLTADIEREKNHMAFIESVVVVWQENRLNLEISRLE